MIRKLNFACGNDIRRGWDNCDIQNGQVIYCNADKFPYPFKDNTYDYVLLRQCLNLFLYPRRVLLELRRITKDKSIIEIEVPYYNNKGASNDFDVLHYFNEYTFINLCKNDCRIDKTILFKIVSFKLNPTIIGRLFPGFIRKRLVLFFNGLIGNMRVKLKVIK